MKKVFLTVLIIFIIISCQREIICTPFETDSGFTAEIESFGGSTKTSLNEQNSIEWSENDRIAVFQGFTIADVFEVTSASAGKTKGTFKEVASEGGDGFVSGTEITDNIAVYPYYKELECSNGVLSDGELRAYKIENVYYPINQRYQAESFPDDAFVMVAVTEGINDRTLKFRNASGAVRLRIKGSVKVKTISITGNDNEPIAGYATVIAYKDSSSPVIERSDIMGYTVNLYCEDGVQLDENTPTEFIMALPPTVFEKGFTVRITDVNDVVSEHITAKRNIVNRSRILNMPEITFGKSGSSADGKDYVDEYGVNHGKGTEIDGVIWAPVNCGYHKTDYKYGKLYQWGRKYGQGYDSSDASVPTVKSGPVSLSTGQSSSNKNNFYKATSFPYDWLYPQNDKLWNSGTESAPVKTEYDPCPVGWRIPTSAELDELRSNKSSWTTSDGQKGYWFSGSTSYSSTASRIFLPAAGYRSGNDGNAYDRGNRGYYWSSRPYYGSAYYLYFYGSNTDMYSGSRANGRAVRCVQDDAALIPVSSLTLSKTSLSLDVAKTATLSATITPSNANHQSAHWWSDNESIATVDQNGKVTAVSAGTATITAMAGMQTATCTVTVTSTSSKQKDYVDEYGVNHGKGTEIDGVIWAPVNCGYHKTDYKYGKLYQWGRKYGQGYSGDIYNVNGSKTGTYSDNTVPTIQSGPVTLSPGQSSSNKNCFYKVTSSPYDWLYSPDDKLWNSGTEENPVKAEYDPCPDGWRIPTYAELDELRSNRSSWTTNDAGQAGYWFSGSTSYSATASRIFLPAAGCRFTSADYADARGYYGYYWSSIPGNDNAYHLLFYGGYANMSSSSRALGYSVRCVQDDAELIAVSSLTLSKTSLSLDVSKTATLSATITPSNANHQSAHWWSDNENIATVDQNGKVTAVSASTTTITAMAGMQTATCTVTVTSTSSKQKDYVDEYGVNHGKGTEIDGVIWAPVNCGYHKTDYKYGKLYQWGRKYGQGYDNSDASVPTLKSGPVSLSTGQSSSNKNVFYTSSSSYNYDWLSPQNDKLWNSGTENNPVKTEYDPCPSGWRVPTYAELDELRSNKSSWTTSDGQEGYWFSGSASYSSTASRIFLPAAGRRKSDGDALKRGSYGSYWSLRPSNNFAYILHFGGGGVDMSSDHRARGYSVRCVQE